MFFSERYRVGAELVKAYDAIYNEALPIGVDSIQYDVGHRIPP